MAATGEVFAACLDSSDHIGHVRLLWFAIMDHLSDGRLIDGRKETTQPERVQILVKLLMIDLCENAHSLRERLVDPGAARLRR